MASLNVKGPSLNPLVDLLLERKRAFSSISKTGVVNTPKGDSGSRKSIKLQMSRSPPNVRIRFDEQVLDLPFDEKSLMSGFGLSPCNLPQRDHSLSPDRLVLSDQSY